MTLVQKIRWEARVVRRRLELSTVRHRMLGLEGAGPMSFFEAEKMLVASVRDFSQPSDIRAGWFEATAPGWVFPRQVTLYGVIDGRPTSAQIDLEDERVLLNPLDPPHWSVVLEDGVTRDGTELSFTDWQQIISPSPVLQNLN